jgi:putative tributyrin esterase
MNMALLNVRFFSPTLGMQTEMNVILPQAVSSRGDGKFPVLFLYHGMSDDCSIWLRRTSIERYAEGKGLAIVMPTAGLSWYVNQKCMGNFGRYFDFFSQELPQTVRTLFPQISADREDNFVAGLSMGGYGAFNMGINASENFSAAASLSGAVDMAFRSKEKLQDDPNPYWTDIFGNEEEFLGGKFDLAARAEWLKKSGKPIPRFYMWCGTEDFLYAQNLSMKARLNKLGFDLTYEESEGNHSWVYWDRKIRTVLEWLGFPPND